MSSTNLPKGCKYPSCTCTYPHCRERKDQKHTYTIEFLRPAGCEPGIALDMARFDAGQIIRCVFVTGRDLNRPPVEGNPNLRIVTIQGKYPPTDDRWRSFAVGAILKEEKVT